MGCGICTYMKSMCRHYSSLFHLIFVSRFLKFKTIETANLNVSLNFNQVNDLVKQLPYKEKLKLNEVLKNETKQKLGSDTILTHFAS